MSIKGNIEICVDTRLGSKWPVDRCNARTRRGTACQKSPMKGKKRCRLRLRHIKFTNICFYLLNYKINQTCPLKNPQ